MIVPQKKMPYRKRKRSGITIASCSKSIEERKKQLNAKTTTKKFRKNDSFIASDTPSSVPCTPSTDASLTSPVGRYKKNKFMRKPLHFPSDDSDSD